MAEYGPTLGSEFEVFDVDAPANLRERIDHSGIGGHDLGVLALREGNVQGVVEAPSRTHGELERFIRQFRGGYKVDGYSTKGEENIARVLP